MLVKDLNAIVRLASKISHPSSLTSLYRSVELNKDTLRCVSEFGNMAINVGTTGLENPVLVDASSISGVTKTLPQDAEITLTQDERVTWRCGSAHGKWNIVFSEHAIPEINHTNFPWKPNDDLANALVLASSACAAVAVAVGMYGIVLEAEGDKLRLMSANPSSLASVTLEKGTFPVDKVTLRPPVPGIIATFIATCPNCMLDITNEGIFIQGDWLKAHLPISGELEHDLKEIADQYPLATQLAPISSAQVRMFITRAQALCDKNASFTVALAIEKGRIILRHESIASSIEEFFLCEGLNEEINYAPVQLSAAMLLVCLPFVQTAVLDYLGQSTIIMKGSDPKFDYIVGGNPNR